MGADGIHIDGDGHTISGGGGEFSTGIKNNGYDYTKVGGIAIETTRKAKKDISSQLSGLFETPYNTLSLSQDSLWDEFVSWSDDVWMK